MSEDWQVCASMHHVGDDHDPTVEWRDLGLFCETCYGALVDRRHIAVTDEMVERAARVLWMWDFEADHVGDKADPRWWPDEIDDDADYYRRQAREALAAALGEEEKP